MLQLLKIQNQNQNQNASLICTIQKYQLVLCESTEWKHMMQVQYVCGNVSLNKIIVKFLFSLHWLTSHSLC